MKFTEALRRGLYRTLPAPHGFWLEPDPETGFPCACPMAAALEGLAPGTLADILQHGWQIGSHGDTIELRLQREWPELFKRHDRLGWPAIAITKWYDDEKLSRPEILRRLEEAGL